MSSPDLEIIDWSWDFGDGSFSNEKNPSHIYDMMSPEGAYDITLIITDIVGCKDTVSRPVYILKDSYIWIPNVFTPDNEPPNNYFCINPIGIKHDNFIFNIYSRFNELVYSTNKLGDLECVYNAMNENTNGWNGNHHITQNPLPIGTYFYEIGYTYTKNGLDWNYRNTGHIDILR